MIAKHAVMLDLERGNPGRIAVTGFKCRNIAPPTAAGIAEIIKCGIIFFGDIAALRTVYWRRGHQRAAEQVNQCCVAIKFWKECQEQRRQIANLSPFFAQMACLTQPIT